MSINYSIQATIVDIRSDTPKASDTFLVDTNVWYWLFYNPSPPSGYYQVTDYISYITQARSAHSLLAYSGLSLAELAHIIEREEREIFNPSLKHKPKEYRHNYPSERANVFYKVQTAWNQVKTIAVPVDLTVNETVTDAALNRFGTDLLDGYDLFILETMQKEGITNIITDDGDFSSVSGINVFTANHNVINTAHTQGKLIVR